MPRKPHFVLAAREGLAPKQPAASAADDVRYGMEARQGGDAFLRLRSRQPARASSRGNALSLLRLRFDGGEAGAQSPFPAHAAQRSRPVIGLI